NLFQISTDISVWPGQLQEKYGDFYEVYIGPLRLIWLCREDLISKMMSPSNNSNFHNRVSANHDGMKEIGLLDTGLSFNSNFKTWQYYRRFFGKTMSKASFLVQALDFTQEVLNGMENYWEELGEDITLEFSRWAKRYFVDTLFLIATGKPARSLASYYNELSIDKKVDVSENALKESEVLLQAIEDLSASGIHFMIFPKFIRDFPGIRLYTQRLKNSINWLRKKSLDIIKARREDIEKTPKDQELTPNILTMFLTINTSRDVTESIVDSLHDKPMSDEEIGSLFLEILLGGIHTSSNTICYLIYYISHYPKVKERLIEEIDRVLGKDLGYKITLEDIGKLEYCEAIIHECSRVVTLVPVLYKKNNEPDEIGRLMFPAETQFFIYCQGIHKHKSLWTNPEEFNPERFIENPESKKHIYTFGGGQRKCPGRNLAMLQLKLSLASLYRKYDIKLVDNNAPIKNLLFLIISFVISNKKL
ncbi:16839_t:CDS:2, partial [Acaulospora morrowiae]